MLKSDEENLVLVTTQDAVDEMNAKFYSRFSFPWHPIRFDYPLDPYFEVVMLNQNIGDWEHKTIPEDLRIWVAGCGTNQAIFAALRFQTARVIGSDISVKSLQSCADVAESLGISNLELRQESINHAPYEDEFDYIICTGVIHHNADPAAALSKLAAALKRTGILELMVYNRYHRVATSAFQRAIRILSAAPGDFGSELEIVKLMLEKFPVRNLINTMLGDCKNIPEAALADTLMQPVEYSYTVGSLHELAVSCGLDTLLPCFNHFNKTTKSDFWNIEFQDDRVQGMYDSLSDSDRWQVSNLLLFEQSPMLWFYLQRADSDRRRKSEQQICDEFLNTKFVRASTAQGSYVLNEDGKYRPAPATVQCPAIVHDATLGKVLQLANGDRTGYEILRDRGIAPNISYCEPDSPETYHFSLPVPESHQPQRGALSRWARSGKP